MCVSQLCKQGMNHCRLQHLQEAARRMRSRPSCADRRGGVLQGKIEGRADLLPAAWVASWGSLMLLWLSRASWQPTMPFQAAYRRQVRSCTCRGQRLMVRRYCEVTSRGRPNMTR